VLVLVAWSSRYHMAPVASYALVPLASKTVRRVDTPPSEALVAEAAVIVAFVPFSEASAGRRVWLWVAAAALTSRFVSTTAPVLPLTEATDPPEGRSSQLVTTVGSSWDSK